MRGIYPNEIEKIARQQPLAVVKSNPLEMDLDRLRQELSSENDFNQAAPEAALSVLLDRRRKILKQPSK